MRPGGFPGFYRRGFCILLTHTFDHAARPSLKKSNEIHKKLVLYIEKLFALRAPFIYEIHKKINENKLYIEKLSALRARGLSHLIEK